MHLRPAVFLDRDGVLVVPDFRNGRSYAPRTLETFRLYPDALGALTRLKAAGYLLVVVTNQPDIGNGDVLSTTVDAMHRRMLDELPLDRVELCSHRQSDGCACRKPKPGMLLNAARDCGIDLAQSFIVGDRASDIEAGIATGCTTIFIDLHYTAERPPAHPDYVAQNVAGAADIILSTRF